jgi:restriction endonuclease S subunit
MAVFSIIQKSQLEGAHRLDAEYYQPEYLTYVNKIKELSKPLVEFVKLIKHPAEIERIYEESGVPFLLTQNISPEIYTLQFEEKRFIRNEDAQRIPQNRLLIGDVVMTRTGANYGDAAVYLGEPDELFASAHILIIRPQNTTGEFLSTFLNSKIGMALVRRGVYGTSQPEISPEYLKTIPIPQSDVKIITIINENVRLAHQKLKDAKSLHLQAENLFLKELGLKEFKPKEDLAYVANLSDVKSAHRVDSEYFQPKYERVIEKIKKYNIRLLGDLVTMKKGFEPGSEEYQDDGKLFIRVSSISKLGIIDKDQKYLSDELYQELRSGFEPKAGEILLTKDATPGIAYVLKEPLNGIISSGIMRLKIKEDIEAEYLALCINSVIGQMQIERDAGGSIIAHWKPEQIKNLQLPILPKPIQQKIADLVRQSHEARKKAKELLEEAKKMVEDMIENT